MSLSRQHAVFRAIDELLFALRGPKSGVATAELDRIDVNRYLVVIEVTDTGFSAYSPDLPGCVSTGATRQEVEANMKEAVEFHLDRLKQERYPIPEPTAESVYLDVAS